jgi:hypothetical protein
MSLLRPYSRSWITPEISLVDESNLFIVEVPSSDPDLLEFVANGEMQITRMSRKKGIAIAALLQSSCPLFFLLTKATWIKGKLKPESNIDDKSKEITAYFHGAFYLPDTSHVALIIGKSHSATTECYQSNISLKAKEEWKAYKELCAERENEKARKKRSQDEWFDKLTPEQQTKYGGVMDYGASMSHDAEPTASFTHVLPLLQSAMISHSKSIKEKEIQSAILRSLQASCLQPPRDGEYEGQILLGSSLKYAVLLTWQPRGLLPAYPEIRAALKCQLAKAFKNPRSSIVSPPEIPSEIEVLEISVGVENISQISGADINRLHDLRIQNNDFPERVKNGKSILIEHGFEAIGFYQSHHIWDEDTWGIYLHAEKLEDMACMFHDELSKTGEHSQGLAVLLAVNLVYQHEFFHAKVDACLSWLELTSRRPKYLKYKSNVYQVLKRTDDWLEEALANWFAMDWLNKQLPQLKAQGLVRDIETVKRVVSEAMDLSPPGYRNWHIGDKIEAWRNFSTELSSAKPIKKVKPLPIESILTDLPFEMLESDIPTRIVGRGVIADWLLSSPANFSTPTRREIEKALKYFGYQVDKARGKGSHEMWSGKDNHGFPIPRRDPLSRGVFKSFLHHFGLDKVTYIEQIRPQL